MKKYHVLQSKSDINIATTSVREMKISSWIIVSIDPHILGPYMDSFWFAPQITSEAVCGGRKPTTILTPDHRKAYCVLHDSVQKAIPS